MKVLHAFNRHRGGGGSDNACDATIRMSREAGLEVSCFERDSRDIVGVRGKLTAFISGIYARQALSEFALQLDRERPDIVHTHELYPLISPWVLALCARRGIPVVHACYDFRMTCPIATHSRAGKVCTDCLDRSEVAAVLHNCRGNLAESAAYALRNGVARSAGLFKRHVSRFVVLTEFSRRWLVTNAGIDPQRIAVNAPAVEAAAAPADPAAGDYIAFAGRLVPEKGADLLVEVARKLRLPVRLAGNVSGYSAIRSGDPVTCHLTPTRADLVAFYRGARMLVVPSLWFETFALVAAEAMGQGIPVIASRIGALQETVQDGVTGVLVPPGDAAALAEAVALLWNDPQLAQNLGRAGHRRVVTEFSSRQHVARLIAIYESVLAEHRRLAA